MIMEFYFLLIIHAGDSFFFFFNIYIKGNYNNKC
jgi:hypothetical protein